MFSVDPHLWLQTVLDWPWMLALMQGVSALGTAPGYVVAIAVLAFGVRLRVGITLMLAIALMTGTTHAIKHSADLPRPSDVDARVLDKGRTGRSLVDAGGATRFWSLPSEEAIAAFRAHPDQRDPGLTSGHVGTATASVVAVLLALGIRHRLVWLLAAFGYPALMALSRMYLGRHFLADVIGGWAIGLLAGFLAWRMIQALPARHITWRLLPIASLTLLWAGLAASNGLVSGSSAGLMLGIFLLAAAFQHVGWPDTPDSPWRRLIGPILFVAVTIAILPSLTWLAGALSMDHARCHEVFWYGIGTALAVALTLRLQSLGWKKPVIPQAETSAKPPTTLTTKRCESPRVL